MILRGSLVMPAPYFYRSFRVQEGIGCQTRRIEREMRYEDC